MKVTLRQAGWCLAAAAAAMIAFASPQASADDSPDADEILSRTDEIRNPQESFVVDVTLRAYEDGNLADENFVTTHSRQAEGTGQFLTIVYINEPASNEGSMLLRNGNRLWFHDPDSNASVRMSPRQRLLGNASNGDVITANFALDYSVELAGTDTVTDGYREEREAYELHLTAHNDAAPYHQVTFWVDVDTYRPIAGRFYAQSGRLLKMAWYRGWEEALGEVRPTEVIIADGFEPDNVTVMTMDNFRAVDMPESWFTRDWLPRFRKQ